MIYLDHAASTPIVESALNIYIKSLREDFANPSAAHKLGKSSMKKVERARQLILKSLKGSKKDQLIFLSSATEANNLAIKGIKLLPSDRVHYSVGDHPSTSEPVKSLNSQLVEIPLLEGGVIDEAKFLESLDKDSKLVVLSHVNNQSGNHYDILSLGKKVKDKFPNIHIHVDGVQGLTKVETNLSSLIDSYTISGHKIGAPKGVGALFIKDGVEVETQLHGGGHEFGIRSSTVNTPLILSLCEAITAGLEDVITNNKKVKRINSLMREELEAADLGITFPFSLDDTSPYILSFLLPSISSDIVLRHLEMKDIYVASSSACSSKAKGFNAGFDAMKIDQSKHKFVLRTSFSKDTTTEDIETFVKEITNIIKEIKRL
ncbi:cysteine desulfurase family protein [Halobacteriovorax sp.]|uniref:cysteine desulfurase family protein n=1 Tax=Halobacteriovorax sp. TaxID=2020862 RepID=UPI0035673364